MNATAKHPNDELITGEGLLAMGDIGPCELIDGRIVPTAPGSFEHGVIEVHLGSELTVFVRQHNLGWVMGGETGIYIRRRPDTVRSADIAFVSLQRLAKPTKGFLEIAPELVAEIMSPEDHWQAMRNKLADYFSIGVARVWIVEPQTRKVLVFSSTTDVEENEEGDTLRGEGALEGFAMQVAELFAG
jgi:Uma2 family endonuclease